MIRADSQLRQWSRASVDRHLVKMSYDQISFNWRYVAAPDGVSMMAVPEQVPRCGQADIQGFDIPPLAGLPSS